MSKIDEIERQIQGLTAEELAAFRRWFAEFDANVWDRQFESDVASGKLDSLGTRARQSHASGKSTKI